HHNQDTGLQFQNTSTNDVCVQNLLYANGDHGADHSASTGIVHVNEVASGNAHDGFSFQGNSFGCSLLNCIAANNGVTAALFDLYVDATSTSGFTSDYNIFFNGTAQA